ncbi:MAG: DinB family protein [Edaphobacter sp.]
MRRVLFTGVLCILVAGIGVPSRASAQAAATTAHHQATAGETDILLAHWNAIGNKLIAQAEDFPEDKYEYKPTPQVRSFAAQLIHAAAVMYWCVDSAAGKKPRYSDDPARDNLKTKAQVVAFVKKAVRDGAVSIQQQGDAGARASVKDWDGKVERQSDLAYEVIEHSGEHYGQLVVYYRLNGLVPPESRPKK